MDDNQIVISRFSDLAQRAYSKNIYTYSDFLGLNEQNLFNAEKRNFDYAGYSFFGGYDFCERIVVCFGQKEISGFEQHFPVVCIKAQPLNLKFADEITHRDVLGSIMNLGIERCKIGDIFIHEKCAFFFCIEGMSDYIVSNLKRIRHTDVKCSVIESLPFDPQQNLKEKVLRVSSIRIDCIISALFNLSREESKKLVLSEKVFCNGAIVSNTGKTIEIGSVISVRGYGRCIFDKINGISKKGKQIITVRVF